MSSILDINVSQIVYNYAFTIGGTGLVLWAIFRFGVHKAIEDHMKEIRTELQPLIESIEHIDKRTDRIEYALYNDGKTGLINKVDALIENQAKIKTDVAVLKSQTKKAK